MTDSEKPVDNQGLVPSGGQRLVSRSGDLVSRGLELLADPSALTLISALPQIVDAIRSRQRFVICSHSRPTGDSIGSQLALAYALRALGKDVRVVNHDPAPQPLLAFPGVRDIEIASHVDGNFDAAIILECGDRSRTGLTGLDRFFVINIDHSRYGNTAYGQINWFDVTAAACGEMVFELVRALGVALSLEIATHLYLAILTDTGSFHYSHVSTRTFNICKETLEAGVDPVAVARNLYDANTMCRLKLFGSVLRAIQLDSSGRIALMHLDQNEDLEGIVNLPLTVKEIQAVLFFQHVENDHYRVSLRSKGDIDVGIVAKELGGGGHRNAASCMVYVPAAQTDITFETFGEIFVDSYSKAREKASWEDDAWMIRTIMSFRLGVNGESRLGERPLSAVLEADLEAFIRHLGRSGRTVATRNHFVGILKTMSAWAVRKGYRSVPFVTGDSDVLQRRKARRRNRRLEPGEEDGLLRAAGAHLQRVIIAALETCCRLGELLQLQWRDVSLARGEIHLRAEKTKTRTDRIIPISTRLRGVLEMVRNDPAGEPFGPTVTYSETRPGTR